MLEDSKDEPILWKISDPSQIYFQSLKQFKNLMLYANVCNDWQVNFCTAAIEKKNFFLASPDVIFEHKRYKNVVSVELTDEYSIQRSFKGILEQRDYSDPQKVIDNFDHPFISKIIDSLNLLQYAKSILCHLISHSGFSSLVGKKFSCYPILG